ncbi:ChaN family lipoprotein [Amphritea japonica]|nr:ChaN family lipoprotein [Amphritea japonica]
MIYSTQSGLSISYTKLLNELTTSRFILVGEKHDNPHHHQLELMLLQDLQNKSHTRVVLEMLDEQQTSNLDELTPRNKTEEIKDILNWNDRSWPWDDYGPLISSALANGNQIAAGNLSKPLLMQIYKHSLPEEARFETVKAVPETIQAAILQQVYDSHCQAIPLTQMEPMAQIQISRDASMAFAMNHQLPANAQSILFAGAFHARKDSGVPLHLKMLSEEKSSTLLLIEIEEEETQDRGLSEEDKKLADYIWFTPRSEKKDYCASLRQQSH